MNNPGLHYTQQIVDHIDQLAQTAGTGMVTEHSTEKDYLTAQVTEARHLIKYNEWFVALEMLLVNLDEIDYKLDAQYVELAQKIVEMVAMNRPEVLQSYGWLDKLKK